MPDWLIVANPSIARIYTIKSRQNMRLAKEIAHPESRLKNTDLVNDRPGHNRSPLYASGGFTASSDPKKNERERFAKQLADLIEHGRVTGQFYNLHLFAPAHFYGLLESHLTPQAHLLIKHRMNKDYTKHAEDELLEMVFPEYEPISI